MHLLRPEIAKIRTKYVVYMLHFPNDIKGKRHYVGSCLTGRLFQRLHEHAIGRGSNFTHKLTEANDHFLVSAIFPTEDRASERKIKRTGNYKGRCHLCKSQPELWPYIKINIPVTSNEANIRFKQMLDLQYPYEDGWRSTHSN